ncbi:MAG TPA: hypothetical protein PKD54_11465, partial [Pirellulaceae bacterium]|nr:hypothetical protein [Pirellulaceae bacterium]
IDASPEGLAEPFRQFSSFEERRSAILKFAGQLLRQLPTDVQMIHAISGLNGTGHRWMSYPQQLQLAVDLMELIDDACPGTESMISFDSPWAERLAWSVGGNSPLAIADTLLRRGLNITAFGLDIQLDYWPAGSLPRDPLQWLELVDLWAQLGLPLIINLCAPSPAPVRDDTSGDIAGPVRGSLSDDQLIQLLGIVLPLLVARPAVSGICWSHLRDGDDPRFPLAGMMDEHNRPKRLFEAWQQWRALVGAPAS